MMRFYDIEFCAYLCALPAFWWIVVYVYDLYRDMYVNITFTSKPT